jgi:hypothetical protein
METEREWEKEAQHDRRSAYFKGHGILGYIVGMPSENLTPLESPV